MSAREEEIDGVKVLVMYLNDDFEPVEPEKATIVKINWPDGRVEYAVPAEDAA